MASEKKTKDYPVADQMELALDRTFLAHERTLLAWINTATSLITFGFTLYKFFFYLREQQPDKPVEHLLGPRTFGLIMMGIGVFALSMAIWQHRAQVKKLRAQAPNIPKSISLWVAGLIAILGILGFVAAVQRQ